jgi:drug/metabolite transporter (DMT)-like permease
MSELKNNRLKIIIAYLLIYVVWGSTYYIIGIALKGFPTFLLGAVRFSAAGILLLGYSLWTGEIIFKKKLLKNSAISGIILLFFDMIAVMIAQRYINSSLTAIIAASTTIWIMVLDVPMWKKNFSNIFSVTGVVTGFLGVLLVYIEQQNSTNLYNTATGIIILIFGCISWALGTLYTKYHSSENQLPDLFAGSAWQMLFAGGMFWIFSFYLGEVNQFNISQVSPKSWFSLFYLIIFGSLLAYSAYIWLLKVRPAAEVATHAYINPFVAVIIGYFIGNEYLTLIQITGLSLLL